MDRRPPISREHCAQIFDLGPRIAPRDQLKCPGVGRDKDCDKALQFYFDRPVTNGEMRFLHECMQRSVALMPRDLKD